MRVRSSFGYVLAIWSGFFISSGLLGRPPAERACATSQDMVLWYRSRRRVGCRGTLGNGMIGAMVFGGVPEERIALNESSFWSGRPHDYDDPEAFKYFGPIRDLVFADKFQEAETLADAHFKGLPNAGRYQPIGDLVLNFEAGRPISDYRRELDMETGVAKVSYRVGDAVITRQAFVSWPDRVFVCTSAATSRGAYRWGEVQGPLSGNSAADSGRLVMDGTWKGPFPPPRAGSPRTRGRRARVCVTRRRWRRDWKAGSPKRRVPR